MRGTSIKAVQEILSHSDLRISHLSPAHLQGAVERLEGLTSPGTAVAASQVPAPAPLVPMDEPMVRFVGLPQWQALERAA